MNIYAVRILRASSAATVSITINAVNDAPTAASQSVTTDEDTAKAITLSGSDVDGDALTYNASQPSHGSVSCTGASCIYTPTANYNGSDSFTFKANDGKTDSAAATVSITVNPVNDNPDAINDSATVTEDSGANTVNVLGNDSILPDTGETLTVSSVTQGANGAVAITGGGTKVSYTPAANYFGSDSFTYTISDGNGGTATATVNVTVTAVNDAPTMTGATVARQQASPGTVSTTATVSDVDNSAASLTVAVTSLPAGVTVSGITNTNGTITAMVTAGCGAAVGANSVGLKVTDSNGAMGTGTLTVNVTKETTPPVINPNSYQNITVSLPANSNATSMAVTFPLPTATDNCGGAVTVTTSPVSGSTFNLGTTTVQVTATDQAGNQSFATFTVTVLYRFSMFQYSDLLLSETELNQVTAGSTLPVRFTLSGFKGNPYSSPPTSQRFNCSTNALMGAASVINRTLPDPQYDATFDFYQTTWKTEAAWKFQCRRLTLSLKDGTTRTLKFYFK